MKLLGKVRWKWSLVLVENLYVKFSTGYAVCSSDGTLPPSVNLALPRITGTKVSVLQTMCGCSPNPVCDNSRMMKLLYIKVGDIGVSECLSL